MDAAERKYQHLSENSTDLIFLLDESAHFTRINAAVRKALGFRPDEMKGKSIYDFIADGPDNNVQKFRDSLKQSFTDVLATENLVKLRTRFRMKHIIAGTDVDLALQKNLVDGKSEILGKTTAVYPESSELFLTRERGTYFISSNIAEGELITRGLIARLVKFFDASEIKKFQVGLNEILLNAIEHGNLGITFDEKSREMEEGDYTAFLLKRQKDAKYADKKVRIDFAFDTKKIIFRITDAGDGFDHKSYLRRVDTDDTMLQLEHGRGILITKNVFDRIEYNEKGNQILLVKNR